MRDNHTELWIEPTSPRSLSLMANALSSRVEAADGVLFMLRIFFLVAQKREQI